MAKKGGYVALLTNYDLFQSLPTEVDKAVSSGSATLQHKDFSDAYYTGAHSIFVLLRKSF